MDLILQKDHLGKMPPPPHQEKNKHSKIKDNLQYLI